MTRRAPRPPPGPWSAGELPARSPTSRWAGHTSLCALHCKHYDPKEATPPATQPGGARVGRRTVPSPSGHRPRQRRRGSTAQHQRPARAPKSLQLRCCATQLKQLGRGRTSRSRAHPRRTSKRGVRELGLMPADRPRRQPRLCNGWSSWAVEPAREPRSLALATRQAPATQASLLRAAAEVQLH